ncbi:MAG: hypothetical protein CME33_25575 [Gimesia sp.]|uniref:hypothetical protein n=1 Tax=Gimesia sp. TaxID=2024833 RepID=UPI000C640ECA|nr:hypothetical protein [Gimesia sp.]MAX39928.1 hypothetical protein [Gimesia sp.]
MGWTFPTGVSRQELIRQRTRPWERELNGVLVKSTCLAFCFKGGKCSGVLWAVWERTFEREGEQVERTQRWITCDLITYEGDEWNGKNIDEFQTHHFYVSPQKHLELVSTERYGENADW